MPKFYNLVSILVVAIVLSACQSKSKYQSFSSFNGIWTLAPKSIDIKDNAEIIDYSYCKSKTITQLLDSPWPFMLSVTDMQFIQIFEEQGIMRVLNQEAIPGDESISYFSHPQFSSDIVRYANVSATSLEIESKSDQSIILEQYTLLSSNKFKLMLTITNQDTGKHIEKELLFTKRNDTALRLFRCETEAQK